MAVKKSTVKREVRGRSRSGSEKVLQNKEQNGTEVKSVGNHEVRTDAVGFQGGDQGWADIAINVMIAGMSNAVTQGLLVGINKENVSTMGLSYFVRLYDSLLSQYDVNYRRQKIVEIIDLYFLACSDQQGAA